MQKLNNIRQIFPLSPVQQGILFHVVANPNELLYIEQIVYTLSERLNISKIKTAYAQLIERHDILRTVFAYQKMNDPKQVTLNQSRISFHVHDLSGAIPADTEKQKICLDAKYTICDLSKGPLIRLDVFLFSSQKCELCFTYHHIILDGWSMSLLFNELAALYFDACDSESNRNDIPFEEYIHWMYRQEQSQSLEVWKQYLEGYETDFRLFPQSSLSSDTYQLQEKQILCPTELHRQIKKFVRLHNFAQYTFIKGVFAILLSIFGQQEDIVFGEVNSGRDKDIPGLEKMIGLLINTVPTRIKISKQLTFLNLLHQIANSDRKMHPHDYVGLSKIQSIVGQPQSLIRYLLVFENYPDLLAETSRIKVEEVQYYEHTNYELNCIVSEIKDTLLLRFNYNGRVLTQHNIHSLASMYIAICRQVLKNADTPIGQLSFQSDYDKGFFTNMDKLAMEPMDINPFETVDSEFEKVAEHQGHSLAIVSHHNTLTYNQLSMLSAFYGAQINNLSNAGIVAIYMKRSIELVIAILAILKAGKTFVVIHPDYPEERCRYILKDADCDLVLTDSENVINLRKILADFPTLKIELDANVTWDILGVLQKKIKCSSDDMLYLVYTSGTTGYPKGVMVPHRTLLNLIRHQQKYSGPTCDGRVLMFANPCFDVCYQEIFSTLFSGGTLYVAEETVKKDPELLIKFLSAHQISTAFFPTAFFNTVMEEASFITRLPIDLTDIVVAGEQLVISEEAARALNLSGVTLHNHYGPSETHVCTIQVLEKGNIQPGYPSIGTPVSNNRIEIWNCQGDQLPVSAAGEIVVTGVHVGLGYLNQPELTNQKFVRRKGTLYYRTGDSAYLNETGQIIYAGRIDQQIKVRGYRVEPMEIEKIAIHFLPVKSAIALWLDSMQMLVLLLVPEVTFEEAWAKRILSQFLADYMMPHKILFWETIPLTSHGKIDRDFIIKTLSNTQEDETTMSLSHTKNEEEIVLLHIWTELFNLQKIDLEDNFFAIGGDSIKALLLVSKLHKYQYKVSIKDVYSNPTIRSLACVIIRDDKQQLGSVSRMIRLTPIQEMFFTYKHADENRWNQSLFLYSPVPLDRSRIESAWEALLIHHDVLRSRFKREGDAVVQVNLPPEFHQVIVEEYDFRQCALFDEKITCLCDKLESRLDLSEGPIIRCGLFKTQKGDHLLIVVHHLIIDAVSWRILLEDLSTCYQMDQPSRQLTGQSKSASFAQWSDALFEYLESPDLESQIPYWISVSEEKDTSIGNCPETDDYVEDSGILSFCLGEQETENLIRHTNSAYNTTINDILLSALSMAIYEAFAIQCKKIMLESHGRTGLSDKLNLDLSRTVGWFTCMYPVLLKTEPFGDIGEQIIRTKNMLAQIPLNGIGYGILRYLAKHRLFLKDKPEISFNYLGQFDETFNQTDFQLSTLDPGSMTSKRNRRLFPITLTGQIYNGELTFYIDYNRRYYTEDTISRFLNCYRSALLKVIEHCRLQYQEKKYIQAMPQRVYELSVQQKQMLYYYLLEPQNPLYLIQYKATLTGNINPNALEAAFGRLIQKYDVLRSALTVDGEDYEKQVILPHVEPNFFYKDISNISETQKDDWITQFICNDRNKQFCFKEGNLSRMTLIRYQVQSVVLVWTLHHIITDGWSVSLMIADLFKGYMEELTGSKRDRSLAPSYQKYIQWCSERRAVLERDRYWYDELQGYPGGYLLREPSNGQQIDIQKSRFVLDKNIINKARQLAVLYRVTLNEIFLLVWGALLQYISRRNDVVFGMIISGRPPELDDVERMAGLFTKTLPIRMHETLSANLGEGIGNLHEWLSTAQTKVHCPVDQVCRQLEIYYEDILFIFENYPDVSNFMDCKEKPAFQVRDYQVYSPIACPFALVVEPEKQTIEVNFDRNRYPQEEIQKIGYQYLNALTKAVENPEDTLMEYFEPSNFREGC